MAKKDKAIIFAVLAAALYAVNIPFSKLLLGSIEPTVMAALLYLGAGIGLIIYTLVSALMGRTEARDPFTRDELPYVTAMIVLDIGAPILLMFGIKTTASANVSLLNNFEIAATSVIALIIFKEFISKRLWLAIILVTAASIMLSFEGKGSLDFNKGSLLVLGACICWGFENNCTRKLSSKSAVEITTLKGCFSGLGSLAIAFIIGERPPSLKYMMAALLLGFVAYGLSISFYIKAQKELGAAKTSVYYSAAPFLGVVFSMLVPGERPNVLFYIALLIMIAAAVLMAKDTVALQHTHEHLHVHTHEHRHGYIVHTHEHTHSHSHMHLHSCEEEDHTHIHSLEELPDHDHKHGQSYGGNSKIFT